VLKINKEESLSFKNSKNTHSPDDARANEKNGPSTMVFEDLELAGK
jgi:hypothetical protein